MTNKIRQQWIADAAAHMIATEGRDPDEAKEEAEALAEALEEENIDPDAIDPIDYVEQTRDDRV